MLEVPFKYNNSKLTRMGQFSILFFSGREKAKFSDLFYDLLLSLKLNNMRDFSYTMALDEKNLFKKILVFNCEPRIHVQELRLTVKQCAHYLFTFIAFHARRTQPIILGFLWYTVGIPVVYGWDSCSTQG